MPLKLLTLCFGVVLLAATAGAPTTARANGAYGHLTVGHLALLHIKNLDKGMYDVLWKRLNAYKNGLGFPDATRESGFAHGETFFNLYVDNLAACKKDHGKWSATADCQNRLSHFFGALAHAVTDSEHDNFFLRAVDQRHKKHDDCSKFRTSKKCSFGCTMACDDSSSPLGCLLTAAPPGSQYFTDVLIDYELVFHNWKFGFQPALPYAPSEDLAKIFHEGHKKMSAGNVTSDVNVYFAKVDLGEPAVMFGQIDGVIPSNPFLPSPQGAILMGNTSKICAWGVKNVYDHEPGGLRPSSKVVADLMVKVWKIMAAGDHKPVIKKSGKWGRSEKWSVSEGKL